MSTVVQTGTPDALVVQSNGSVVVEVPEGRTVVVEQPAAPTVVVTRGVPGLRGATGATGPAGPPGGMTYTHTQDIALPVWTVAHNLGRWPSVTVTDHLGRRVEPDVAYLSVDLVQVTHGTPLTGFAYCN